MFDRLPRDVLSYHLSRFTTLHEFYALGRVNATVKDVMDKWTFQELLERSEYICFEIEKGWDIFSQGSVYYDYEIAQMFPQKYEHFSEKDSESTEFMENDS